MKYHLWFFRSFLVQTGEFKAETFFTCWHNFTAIGQKQFHKNLFMVKSSDDNWDLLRVQASKSRPLAHLLTINCNVTSSEASLPILPNTAFSVYHAQAFCLSVCRSLSDSSMVSKSYHLNLFATRCEHYYAPPLGYGHSDMMLVWHLSVCRVHRA